MARILIALILIIATAQIKATTEENLIRDVRSLFASGQHEMPDIASFIIEVINNIQPIISFVKTQIRDIILELLTEVWSFAKLILRHYKIKLFKIIGKFTVADIVRCVFDGVLEFVKEDAKVSYDNSYEEETPISEDGAIDKENTVLNTETISEESDLDPNEFYISPYIVPRLKRKN